MGLCTLYGFRRTSPPEAKIRRTGFTRGFDRPVASIFASDLQAENRDLSLCSLLPSGHGGSRSFLPELSYSLCLIAFCFSCTRDRVLLSYKVYKCVLRERRKKLPLGLVFLVCPIHSNAPLVPRQSEERG